MSEEKESVVLKQTEVIELESIIIDEDKEEAFKFLKEKVYTPIRKRRDAHCKPPV